jgi:hypothetical protein
MRKRQHHRFAQEHAKTLPPPQAHFRFPPDFMFQLSDAETAALIFQSGRSKPRGGRRHNPYAFTVQGVAMPSSMLRSARAVQVNVAIMRSFVSLRRMLAANETLARKIADLERRLEGHDQAIKSLFGAFRELMAPPAKSKREIGFHTLGKEATDGHMTTSKRKYERERTISNTMV